MSDKSNTPPAGHIRLDWSAVVFPTRPLSPADSKISAIRTVRTVTGFGLKEAKDHVQGRCTLDIPEQHRDLFAPWVPLGLVITAAAGVTSVKPARKPRPSRPCECGTDCGRTASGGHRLSRTCRVEVPWREKVAGLEALADAALASDTRARALLGTQAARANRMERDAADALGRLQAAHAERDAATATVRQLTEQVGALTVERDKAVAFTERLWDALAESVEWTIIVERHNNRWRDDRDAAEKKCDAAIEERDGWKTVAEQNAEDRKAEIAAARDTEARLRRHIIAAWSVAALLCVALGVVGVFG